WQEARAASDFAAFRPWLEKIMALKRQEAAAIGYQVSPYDALLDEYEPGATAAEVTRIFAELRTDLVPLVSAILGSSKQAPREILSRTLLLGISPKLGKMGMRFQEGVLNDIGSAHLSLQVPADLHARQKGEVVTVQF